jgi:hypothetical protein
MPTPKQGYSRDGRKLPGVTTILKQDDSSGLIAAANKLGLKGRAIYGPEGEWSLAADIGTATHARIQAHIEHREWKNEEGLSEAVVEASKAPFASFQKWANHWRFEGDCEVGLVHPLLGFGGTIDYLNRDQGIILDWKTSGPSLWDYPEKLYGQIGAYVLLAEAHGIKIASTKVVRFPKEGGDAEELKIDPDSEKAIAGQNLFLALLTAYEQRDIISRKEIEHGLVAKVGGWKR